MTALRLPPRAALLFCTLVLLAVAAVAGGCSSGPQVATGELPDTYPNDSFADIRQALAYGNDSLRAFRAEARLSVDTPERSGSFSSTVRARRGARGDSISMTLSKFGFQGGRILVTPDSFFVYDALNGELTYGSLAAVGARLPAPLRSGQAFENLLGLLVPGEGRGWQVRPRREANEAEQYVLTAEGPEASARAFVVDPARWRVTRYTEHGPGGALTEERAFSEFGRFGRHYLPRRVVLRRPQDESSASLYYRELTPNPSSLPPFELDVPAGTKRTLIAR